MLVTSFGFAINSASVLSEVRFYTLVPERTKSLNVSLPPRLQRCGPASLRSEFAKLPESPIAGPQARNVRHRALSGDLGPHVETHAGLQAQGPRTR